MPHPSSIGYDRIAKWYDDLVGLVFGQGIFDAQSYYLKFIPAGAKILILGGGSGWLLIDILKVCPTAEIWFIDSSSQMIQLAAEKMGESNQVHLIHGTEANIPDHLIFDMVITNFFLDGFSAEELPKVIAGVDKHLNKMGIWLVVDFVQPNNQRQKFILWFMHFFFRSLAKHPNKSLVDWEEALKKSSWSVERENLFCSSFVKSILLKQKSDFPGLNEK